MYGVRVPCMPRPLHARHAMHVGRGALTLATPPVHARGAAANTHRRAPAAAYGHVPQGRARAVATRIQIRWRAQFGAADSGGPIVKLARFILWNLVLGWSSEAGPDPP